MIIQDKIKVYIIVIGIAIVFYACSPADGNKPGHEYFPDMAHSTAYEANLYNYYSYNRFSDRETYHGMVQPRLPVQGTIARGAAGAVMGSATENLKSSGGIVIPGNGSVPYYYGNTEEERTRASNEIIKNPFPITERGLATGQELYLIYCGICHGDKADGNGYLVREDGGVYPVQPISFLTDDLIGSSNGRYYHSIMYGKNTMGSYADKLSYKERWEVIHFIRSLQAPSKGLVYNHLENTLNEVDVPGGVPPVNEPDIESATDGNSGEHQSDTEHH